MRYLFEVVPKVLELLIIFVNKLGITKEYLVK